ncbi:MAG: hypothetical protein IPI54_01995 [Chitinophagaceae bacterium]|nr:hypothetical protein [Chitinophagaceae bacterium]
MRVGRRGGGLAVYTQKGRDLIDRNPTAKDIGLITVAGYTPMKEFYEPDYTLDKINDSSDVRTTLLWLPYILTDANNRKVPVTFYNNDFTKKIGIVLEGEINEDGKMIRYFVVKILLDYRGSQFIAVSHPFGVTHRVSIIISRLWLNCFFIFIVCNFLNRQ